MMKTSHIHAAVAAMLIAAAPPAFSFGASSTESANVSGSFSTWAGGKANSDSLVAGLRNSTAITLRTTAPNGTVSTASFTPTTKPMGFGNVSHTLSIAKRSLANLGITNPTAAQMQAALMGGSITLANGTTTTVQGVVPLRASGLGWGKIAKKFDTSVGSVTSEGKGATTAMGSASAEHGNSGLATAESHGGLGVSHGNSGESMGHSSPSAGGMSPSSGNMSSGPSFTPGSMSGSPGQSGASHGKGK